MKGDDITGVAALIEEVAPRCKKHGIRRIRIEDIEMEFGPSTERVTSAEIEKIAAELEKNMPTDEQILFHSAPGGAPVEPGEA